MDDSEFNTKAMKLFDAALDDKQRLRIIFKFICTGINILKAIKEKLNA